MRGYGEMTTTTMTTETESVNRPESVLLDEETPLAARMDVVADWFLGKDRNLISISAGPGKALRVILRRSVLHPRAKDEVVVLPAIFRELHQAGISEGARFVQDRVGQALGLR